MNYRVDPGLYAIGNPGPDSEVFVSANYRLSFDHLRRAIAGMDAWILVLDTKGINVWCAAGKGTFGTEELVKRIGEVRLDQVVEHRGIIVPQLGAPGIAAHEVKRHTGFRVVYGPVYARNLPAFINAEYKASPGMRQVHFTFIDRLILTPMELIPSLKWFSLFALVWFIVAGLSATGISFQDAWANGKATVFLGLIGIGCGALVTPVLLPILPFRSFALKGMFVGLLGSTAAALSGLSSLPAFIAVPAISSFLAFNFTGASTFTNPSGVRKEFRFAVPLYICAGIITLILLILSRTSAWGR